MSHGEGVKFHTQVIETQSWECKDIPTFTSNDETIRLFESMPKGFEHYIESGPPRIIQDFKDKVKLAADHALQLEQIVHHDLPRELREGSLYSKRERLQESLIRFDTFVKEMRKKQSRAMTHCSHFRAAIMELTSEIADLNDKLIHLREKRDRMEKNVSRFQKMDAFVESILTKTNFEHFINLLDKYEALRATNSLLLRRYTKTVSREEELSEQRNEVSGLAMRRKLFLRQEIIRLTKHLEEITTRNFNIQNQLEQYGTQNVEKRLMYFKMYMAIQNMVNHIITTRPSARKYFQNLTSPCEQLQMIGHLMNTYTHIAHPQMDSPRDRRLSESARANHTIGS